MLSAQLVISIPPLAGAIQEVLLNSTPVPTTLEWLAKSKSVRSAPYPPATYYPLKGGGGG